MNIQSRSPVTTARTSRWDVRAWRVGLICSVLSGLGLVLGIDTGIGHLVTSHAPALSKVFLFTSVFAIFLVLPGVLSGIARRRWLLWAYLPLSTAFLCVVVSALIDVAGGYSTGGGSTPWTRTDTNMMIGVLLSPLATAGPVSLVRWRIAVSRARNTARQAYEDAQYTVERVGVWPPPPTPAPDDAHDGEAQGTHKFQ